LEVEALTCTESGTSDVEALTCTESGTSGKGDIWRTRSQNNWCHLRL